MSRPTRRGLVGSMAALIPTVAAAPAVAVPAPDARLIAAVARFKEANRALDAVCSAEVDDEHPDRAAWEAQEAAALDACQAVAGELLGLPCTTWAGLRALAEAVVADAPEVLNPSAYTDKALMAQLVRAVLAMGGRA